MFVVGLSRNERYLGSLLVIITLVLIFLSSMMNTKKFSHSVNMLYRYLSLLGVESTSKQKPMFGTPSEKRRKSEQARNKNKQKEPAHSATLNGVRIVARFTIRTIVRPLAGRTYYNLKKFPSAVRADCLKFHNCAAYNKFKSRDSRAQ